jgi:predicted SAM-dependent methyltransferase
VSSPPISPSPFGRLGALLGGYAANIKAFPQNPRLRDCRWELAERYLHGSGLEIGALHSPLPLPPDATVRYLDRMDCAGLRGHYPELAAKPLVEVDIVDDGETLSSQPDSSVDFVVANHFIEHTQDPLGTLANHLRVLRPGGIHYLAVPHRRRTFDADRPPTSLEHIVRDHREGPGWSRPIHQEEWARLVDKAPAAEVAARVQELEESDYSIHFHVWAPREFRALLEYAHGELQLPFAIETLRPNGYEFIAILRRV